MAGCGRILARLDPRASIALAASYDDRPSSDPWLAYEDAWTFVDGALRAGLGDLAGPRVSSTSAAGPASSCAAWSRVGAVGHRRRAVLRDAVGGQRGRSPSADVLDGHLAAIPLDRRGGGRRDRDVRRQPPRASRAAGGARRAAPGRRGGLDRSSSSTSRGVGSEDLPRVRDVLHRRRSRRPDRRGSSAASASTWRRWRARLDGDRPAGRQDAARPAPDRAGRPARARRGRERMAVRGRFRVDNHAESVENPCRLWTSATVACRWPGTHRRRSRGRRAGSSTAAPHRIPGRRARPSTGRGRLVHVARPNGATRGRPRAPHPDDGDDGVRR